MIGDRLYCNRLYCSTTPFKYPVFIYLVLLQSTSGTSNTSRVSFRSPTRDASGNLTFQMDSISRQQQKMLGYDWIAALIDNDSNAINQSETFFEDLKEFRRLNLEECVNSMYME